ncbi:ATP cone domain-containing protein [Sphingobacterium sp. UT-1RO-CII-1]|uniref:ATP cone domain-containing protein n=1 Tax=Sphingobacterium sp. UT-1RO-CII-1 TaxID=2995225 RepID=UPI00227BF603|nr:ATP cone domain-containing protein [Sphingobacterium sp. UT-1RO-CII-1]MCY4778942.1 ATP cone domain-containing protein [Sphingobacterium sp. UT-1RO-CII-1]
MRVKKYSGELVPFNSNALKHSLHRSGATEQIVEKVYKDVEAELYDGITTRELYESAFRLLCQHRESYAARYSLKKALRDLGPEGFYFEQWVGRLFANEGYQTITGQTVQGHAVSHEIDVVAVQGKEMIAIECKFRNDIEAKISVTTPMYFMSRANDVKRKKHLFFNKEREFSEGLLVTNAYLTSDSVRFGEYYNLNMLSWDYPAETSLKLRVDDNGLYPITCLTNLTEENKKILLKNQCIAVKDLIDRPSFLKKLQITEKQHQSIMQEAQELVSSLVIT